MQVVLEVHLMNRLARLGLPFSYGSRAPPMPYTPYRPLLLPLTVHHAASAILVPAPYCCHFVYAACVKAKKKTEQKKKKNISFLLCFGFGYLASKAKWMIFHVLSLPHPLLTASLCRHFQLLWVMMAIIQLKQAETAEKKLTYPNRLWLKRLLLKQLHIMPANFVKSSQSIRG